MALDEQLRIDPEAEMLNQNRDEAFEYRKRRHADWTTNYELYRDKVSINRLTQRQSINIPLMKQTVNTLMKDIDDMPVLYFENLDNNKEAELFKNEYWKHVVDTNNMEVQDLVDKKQVILFGRSFDQWEIVDGEVSMNITSPEDILLSRYMNPYDLHSSRYLIHHNIFVPLSQLKLNNDYDQDKVQEIAEWFETKNGVVKNSANKEMLLDKNKKMTDLGVDDIEDPLLGETYVELTLHFVYRDSEKDKDNESYPEQIFYYVEAENAKILMKKPLEEVYGITEDHYFQNHYPYVTWAPEVDRQDVWTDGPADCVRSSNIVLNSYASQLVENRTLRNFGMHYFDSSVEDFDPTTFEPMPWGWYPVPGKPSDTIMKVDIPDLSDSLDEVSFFLQVAEKATGATATSQGVQTERKTTLGEVELALTESKERVKGMSNYYTPAWKRRGEMFIKLVEANPDKLNAVKLYKKGLITNDIYEREVSPEDWRSAMGYRCQVWSQDEKNNKDFENLQKLDAVKASMPDNPKIMEIHQRKLLEFAGLKPDEINEAMQFEQQKRQALLSMVGNGVMMPGMPAETQGQPVRNQQTPLVN